MIKNLLKKPFFLSVAAFSLIACIVRVILLATNIEDDTGFYINPSSFWRILFIIILLSAFIFGFVWVYLLRRRGVLPINLKFDFKDLFSERVIIGIVTASFAANTFYEIFRIANPLPSLLLPQSVTYFAVLTSIASALSLIYFIILSFLYENNLFARSLFCVVPIIWVVFRLLRDFISFTTITTISKNLLDILYLSALLITLFALGRIFTETETSKGLRLYNVTAPITIVLGFVLSIPSVIGYIFGFNYIGESDIFMHIVDLALSIFLIRASMYIYGEK